MFPSAAVIVTSTSLTHMKLSLQYKHITQFLDMTLSTELYDMTDMTDVMDMMLKIDANDMMPTTVSRDKKLQDDKIEMAL